MSDLAGSHINAIAFASELAKAELLPKPYQRKPAMILVAMEMAKDLGCSVVAVMNGTYEMNGRISFYTEFMLAQARRSGVIRSVSYETSGEGAQLAVTARAVLSTGEAVETTVGMPEAQAEGWTRNSKYRTSPEQMLRKRALSRLIRNYCPEVLLGSVGEDSCAEDNADVPTSANISRVASTLTAKLTPRQALGEATNASAPRESDEDLQPTTHERRETPAPVSEDSSAGASEVAGDHALPEPVESRPRKKEPATRARLEQVVREIEKALPDATEISAQGEAVLFDAENSGHRKLVTEFFNALGIPGAWRNLHNAKLKAFLKGMPDLRATQGDVGAAVEEYVIANPPAAKGGQG